jgi:GT2 family glycosyltransferase
VTRTAVVIPNWDGRDWLPGCLDSLAGQTRPADEVIVVDNGSTDGSPDLVRERYPWATVLALGENTGFAFACNRGVEAARDAGYVALINSDVVLAPEWIERMTDALDSAPGAASVACKMVDLDDAGVIYDAGDVLRRDGACDQRGRFLPDDGRWDDPGDVFAACGGAALYRRDAFLAADGGFDQRFFAYLEDVDLGLRLRSRGWTCRYEPRAIARHAGGGTSGQRARPVPSWVERNTLLIVARAFPARWLPLVAYRQLGWAWHAARGGALRPFAAGALAALPLLPRYLLRERTRFKSAASVPIDVVVPAQPIRGPRALGYEAARSSTT